MENNLLQELAKIADINPSRLMIVLRPVADDKFVSIFGEETFGRIDLTIPQSLVRLFTGKIQEAEE